MLNMDWMKLLFFWNENIWRKWCCIEIGWCLHWIGWSFFLIRHDHVRREWCCVEIIQCLIWTGWSFIFSKWKYLAKMMLRLRQTMLKKDWMMPIFSGRKILPKKTASFAGPHASVWLFDLSGSCFEPGQADGCQAKALKSVALRWTPELSQYGWFGFDALHCGIPAIPAGLPQ